MKRLTIVIIISIFLFLSNCATIMRGYYEDVIIENAPKDLNVFTMERVKVPIERQHIKYREPYTDKIIEKEVVKICLRSKKTHTLIMQYGDKERVISLHGKIDIFILFLDTITGLYPAFIDAHTENRYIYENIELIPEL